MSPENTATINGKNGTAVYPAIHAALRFDGIPPETKADAIRWALTHPTPKADGTDDKAPWLIGLERHASASDPRGCHRFSAVEHYIARVRPDLALYPALLVEADGGRVVLDLDDCLIDAPEFDPDSDDDEPIYPDDAIFAWVEFSDGTRARKVLRPWAAMIVEALNTHTTVSLSGTGLRLVVRGRLPVTIRKASNLNGDGTGAVEFFAGGHFATFTGQVLDGYSTVREAPEILTAIFEQFIPPDRRRPDGEHEVVYSLEGFPDRDVDEVLRLCREAARWRTCKFNGKWVEPTKAIQAFARLERGDDSGYPSGSDADWRFFHEVLSITGPDVDLAERVIRATARYQARAHKWDDPRKGGSFLRYDLDRAIARKDPAEYWRGPWEETSTAGRPVGGGGDQCAAAPGDRPLFSNYRRIPPEKEGDKPEREAIDQPDLIINLNRMTDGWPRRVGGVLFAHDGGDTDVVQFTAAEQLMAWIGGRAKLVWGDGASLVSQRRFFEALRQSVPQYEAIERHPHFPPVENVYYACSPAVARLATGKALDGLLDLFRPATSADRELIRAFILTLFWGGPPGKRPMFLAEGPENDPHGGRGVGKSELFTILAGLVGGCVSNVSTRDDISAITKRIINDKSRKRVVMLDNVKAERFSWGDLEGMITGPTIGGHLLYQGDEVRPNVLTYCMTINGASLSEDLAQRTVMIRLDRPASYDRDGEAWSDVAARYVVEHRAAIIADVAAAFDRPAAEVKAFQRWASWTHAVLARCDDPFAVQNVITDRQSSINDDRAASDEFGRFLGKKLGSHFGVEDAAGLVAWVSSDALVPLVAEFTGERITALTVSKKVNRFRPQELTKKNRMIGKGWLWVGRDADPASEPHEWIHGTTWPHSDDGFSRR